MTETAECVNRDNKRIRCMNRTSAKDMLCARCRRIKEAEEDCA